MTKGCVKRESEVDVLCIGENETARRVGEKRVRGVN